jgi:hypothetical protein
VRLGEFGEFIEFSLTVTGVQKDQAGHLGGQFHNGKGTIVQLVNQRIF